MSTATKAQGFREEQDSIGKMQIPADVYYGVQSKRGAENFKITGRKAHPEFIKSITEIKLAAAAVNKQVNRLDAKRADAIIGACKRMLCEDFSDSFIVDPVQGGAGTSFNMNANEVIANLAIEMLGETKGDYSVVHPNDHVNCGQSTNDVYPSAGKLATYRLMQELAAAFDNLGKALRKKSAEFDGIIKMGRTEMQDAVPMTLGQTFGAFASAIERHTRALKTAALEMTVINMGASAIGTGINASPDYIKNIVGEVSKVTGIKLTQSADLVDGTQNADGFVNVSGAVKSAAVTLSKIANDMRLMSSGPRTGLAEINLPPRQNGSSIMPGKINPVIPEVVSEICFNVIGNDTTVTLAAESGQLELNAFEPIIFYCLFESIETLKNGAEIFVSECIDGITANADNCLEDVENSLGIITALCPAIGYTKSANLAKKALKEKKKVREILIEENIMPENEIDKVLDFKKMAGK